LSTVLERVGLGEMGVSELLTEVSLAVFFVIESGSLTLSVCIERKVAVDIGEIARVLLGITTSLFGIVLALGSFFRLLRIISIVNDYCREIYIEVDFWFKVTVLLNINLSVFLTLISWLVVVLSTL